MKGRFVEGDDRRQSYLLPVSLDDYLTPDNPVRVVEVFIEELDLGAPPDGFPEGDGAAGSGRVGQVGLADRSGRTLNADQRSGDGQASALDAASIGEGRAPAGAVERHRARSRPSEPAGGA
jgi:hypothetical protein